ncbi:MAG: FAD-dependent oxidoreductase [Chitinophagales bacterium]
MKKKILIIGGVAGGASAAARLRRLDENAQIIIFERGAEVSFANCGLPYYIGGTIDKRNKLLVQTPKSLLQRYNIDVRIYNEVIQTIPHLKEVEVKNLLTHEIYRESYDYLILSPGAKPILPNIPGIDLPNVFSIRNVPDSDRVKNFIDERKPNKALVIGGGFIGLEMVETLITKGLSVTVVEKGDQVMPPLDYEMAAVVMQHLNGVGNVSIKLNEHITALEGDGKVQFAVLSNGERLETDMVVIGIGVLPETDLAKEAGLMIGSAGGILVNDYLCTSDPYIYAVGDAIQVRHMVTGQDSLLPLAGPANKQGRVAADNIAGKGIKYKGSQGTSIVQVLGLVAATTGANEKSLKASGIGYLKCYLHPSSHATYYPGAHGLAIKLLFTPEGKVLGAQIVGGEGVDKRIDVIATAIRGGMSVYDLQELELSYAPPFSSAKDPVNMAGFIAANIINGENPPVYWNQFAGIDPEEVILLDVRTPKETEAGMLEGAVNIPVDELRHRLHEIPRDKEIWIYCRVGLRGYIATRILQQNGFTRVKNLSGGYLTYHPTVAK